MGAMDENTDVVELLAPLTPSMLTMPTESGMAMLPEFCA